MIKLSVNLDGDNCWPELANNGWVEKDVTAIGIAVLDAGTESGHPSVTIRIDLKGGRVVLAQTTARLFCLAGRMIAAKYPELFEGD